MRRYRIFVFEPHKLPDIKNSFGCWNFLRKTPAINFKWKMCNRISLCWLFFFSHIKGFRIAIIRQQEKLKTARKHLRKLATRNQSDWKSVHCYNNMRKIVVIFVSYIIVLWKYTIGISVQNYLDWPFTTIFNKIPQNNIYKWIETMYNDWRVRFS